jgi:hypothetical protein
MILLYSITVWNDFFPETSPTNLPSQTYSLKQTPSNTYLYVLNCLFSSITSTGNGGALSCTSVTYLLVESTSFFSCKISGGNGGAIYFYNTNSGQCVLHEVYGYDCCTTNNNYGLFIQTNVKNDISSKNYINYSSISGCVNENTWDTLYVNNGKIFCPSFNMSNNKCKGDSVLCYPLSYYNTVTCSFSYSSFADNFATQRTWFILWTGGAVCLCIFK